MYSVSISCKEYSTITNFNDLCEALKFANNAVEGMQIDCMVVVKIYKENKLLYLFEVESGKGLDKECKDV